MATAGAICDRIEQRAEQLGIKIPDRFLLFDYMERELNRLIMKGVFDWAVKVVSGSTITISSGARAADLPSDFGNNFVRYSGPSGNRWLCKLVDTSTDPDTERELYFKSAAQLYDLDFTTTETEPPTYYTVITKAGSAGTKQLVTDRLTDKAYQVRGLYVPSSFTFSADADIPILNGSSNFLESALLRRVLPVNSPEYQVADGEYREDIADIMFEAASNRQARLMPLLSQFGYGNTYSMFFYRD